MKAGRPRVAKAKKKVGMSFALPKEMIRLINKIPRGQRSAWVVKTISVALTQRPN
jgi:hypothetical protein